MTIDQLIDLEIRVRDMFSDLQKEVAHAERHSAPPSQLDGTEGRLSRQDSLLNHEMGKEAQRRRHRRLRLLQRALEMMDSGPYGFCAQCTREIEFERLDAQPETMVCGPCSTGAMPE